MKIEKEIKGEIFCSSVDEFYVKLKIKDERLDWFELDLVNKKIQIYLEKSTQILLGISTYDDYIRLIKDLGLKLPAHLGYKKHWIPECDETYFYVHEFNSIFSGVVGVYSSFEDNIINFYNAFPTQELAEKAINFSRLDRLILLWQYANDCLFEPNWRDTDQTKHKVVFYINTPDIELSYYVRENRIYFKTWEQARAFIEMYKKEIKDIMEI